MTNFAPCFIVMSWQFSVATAFLLHHHYQRPLAEFHEQKTEMLNIELICLTFKVAVAQWMSSCPLTS